MTAAGVIQQREKPRTLVIDPAAAFLNHHRHLPSPRCAKGDHVLGLAVQVLPVLCRGDAGLDRHLVRPDSEWRRRCLDNHGARGQLMHGQFPHAATCATRSDN